MKEKKNKKERTEKIFRMFQQIWKERRHHSEVSGKWLGHEALSTLFHHILPKENYPEAELDKENIILVTWDEHTKVHNNPTFYKEINERRKKLEVKYGRSYKNTVLE